MALVQVQEPEREPISLDMVKAFLKIDHDEEDSLLLSLIKTGRKTIEAYASKCLVHQVWCFSFNAFYASSISDEAYLDKAYSRGKGGIDLPRSPFVQLIQDPEMVTEYGRRPIKDYRIDKSGRRAVLHFLPNFFNRSEDQGVIDVTFKAGYGESPDDVPEPLKHAVLVMVAHLYENRVANDNMGIVLPPLAIELLKPYRFLKLA